ncbi:MurR/RpiR family transcriptional regulator [Konateibacter massiliensis]|uniref:MurR/RpiR family transcriptional regulator n=1 Tax=Konateibacter massiliensis TaxID=2002841 RepID=UPI000C14A3F7|nr:MurR/RpiR family transcriptional regulator [Konateibacter massiliensis]
MPLLYNRLVTTINETTIDSIEYHIAGVMMESIGSINSFSIGEMAKLCSVSKSTISKFVRKLGFDDYIDFKLEAVREHEKAVYIKNQNTSNITDCILAHSVDYYRKILDYDINHLFQTIDKQPIEQLVDDIYHYKKVAAFGEVYSETICLNLQYKMAFYQKFIYTTLNDQKQTEYIRNADEDTLLIIFSNSGRYINVHAMQDGMPQKDCFNQSKGKVVLITSNKEMRQNSWVDSLIYYEHSTNVQNHPILYQLLIEMIAVKYQQKYGFPQDKKI